MRRNRAGENRGTTTVNSELPPISLDTVLSREEGAGEWL